MGKKNQSGGRRGRQMARTNKSMSSKEADDHLSKLEKLRKDAEKQLAHINKVREKKGLPPMKRMTVDLHADIVLRTNDDAADEELVKDCELVKDGDLITGIRVYDRSADGPVGRRVAGEEFSAVHSLAKRVRECYRELDGTMVRVGDVIGTKVGNVGARKELLRRAPSPLKSIMVRLMPHEAEVTGAELTRIQIEAAMDRTAAAFEAETGCEVISAVVHRMSATDLHIHLQYTMIHQVEESTSMLGRRMKPWKAMASKMAREALEADGVPPSPAAIGKKKLDLIASGLLEAAPEAGIEFHKRKGLRSLGDGAILGYSFRQKLNLVRLAEDGGELEIAAGVTTLRDMRGGFAPIAKKSDDELNGKYLDLWLERFWRRSVTDELSEDSRVRLVEAGVEAARNYATFGTTLVEETHTALRIEELNEKAKALDASFFAAKAEEAQNALRTAELDELAKAIEAASLVAKATETQNALRTGELDEQSKAIEAASLIAKAEETRNALRTAKLVEQAKAIEAASLVAKAAALADEEVKTKEADKIAQMAARIADLEKSVGFADQLREEFKAVLTLIFGIPKILKLLREKGAIWKRIEKLAAMIGMKISDLGKEM